MAKNESTAINDLIHLVQGKIVDGSVGDDNLFVTAPKLGRAQPVRTQQVAPTPPVPQPLPRHRAPHATPQFTRVDSDYGDDSELTEVDAHPEWGVTERVANYDARDSIFPTDRVERLVMPEANLPPPVVVAPPPPVRRAPTLPPPHATPYIAQSAVQARAIPSLVPNPVYPSAYPVVQAPAPLPPIRIEATVHRHYSYAEECAANAFDTVRVDPLPASSVLGRSFVHELGAALAKYAAPFGGLVVLLIFVGGYIVHGGQGGKKRAEAPIVMGVAPVAGSALGASAPSVETAMPEAKAVAVAAPVEEVPAGSVWKPRAVESTIRSADEVEAGAEPAAIAESEIEMEPVVATKKRSKRSRSASRVKQVAIAAPAPKVEKVAPVNAEKPVKAAKPEKIAKRASDEPDPILDEINKPAAKAAAKPTGPGKLIISSSVPTLIYVDGRSTNMMTPKTLNLAPGKHKITLLELKTRKAKTTDIEVVSGSSTRLAKAFEAPPSAPSGSVVKARKVKVDTSSALGGMRPSKRMR